VRRDLGGASSASSGPTRSEGNAGDTSVLVRNRTGLPAMAAVEMHGAEHGAAHIVPVPAQPSAAIATGTPIKEVTSMSSSRVPSVRISSVSMTAPRGTCNRSRVDVGLERIVPAMSMPRALPGAPRLGE